MDSGNSSSLQSSSCGEDQEYDSRPESSNIPAAITNSNPSTLFFASSSYPQVPNSNSLLSPNPQSSLAHLPSLFDPYLQTFPLPQTNLSLNPDMVPSRILGNPSASSSSARTSQASLLVAPAGTGSGPSELTTTKVGGRNPRKRTRASRRAPTTVLTTDTSNFRAMVQEFTGIPAPPFSGPSSYSSRRLDLFGAMRSSNLEPVGPLHSLRSLTQKVHQPIPHVPSSSSTSASSSSSLSLMHNIASTSTLNIGSNVNLNTNHAAINASVSASTSSLNPPINNLNHPSSDTTLQNPVLNFQSLLQHPGSMNLPGFGANSHGSSSLSFGDYLGVSHGHGHSNFSGLQDLGTTQRNDTRWREASAGLYNLNDQERLRYFNEKILDNNVNSMGEGRYS